MRKNFGVKTWLYPQPVLIIATWNEDGTPNAMNAAWGGIADFDKIVLDLGSHRTTDNIARTGAFTVSCGTREFLEACDYVGIVSGRDVGDKFAKAGFTASKSEFVNAPVINELPVALECELLKTEEDGRYIGRIVNVSCEDSLLDADGLPDLTKCGFLAFEPVHNAYTVLSEPVGHAFSDGESLM